MNKTIIAPLLLILALALASALAGCGAADTQNNDVQDNDAGNIDIQDTDTQDTEVDQGADSQSASTDKGFPDICSFNAETLDGGQFTQDDLADFDLTVINVWSTGCGPCLREMPELARLSASLPDNVQFITYLLFADYFAAEAAEILDEAGYDGVTLTASDGDLAELIEQVQYIPTTIFVDRDGRQVIEAVIGAPQNPWAAYAGYIDQALGQLGKEELP